MYITKKDTLNNPVFVFLLKFADKKTGNLIVNVEWKFSFLEIFKNFLCRHKQV